MAIKKDLETSYGITIPNAYVRIDGFSGNKTHIDLDVKAYNIVEEDEVYYEYEDQEVSFEDELGNPTTQTQSVRVEKTRKIDVLKLIESLGNYSYIPVIDSETNFIAQGYDYLKGLSQFEGCTDC